MEGNEDEEMTILIPISMKDSDAERIFQKVDDGSKSQLG